MNVKLKQALCKPMKTILDVRVCFDYCSDEADLEEVIGRIPEKFGEFEVLMISEDKDYFMIQNFFDRDGEAKSQIVSHDFYTGKEEY